MFDTAYDLVCFSHLDWDFVFQRPQHILTRFAKHRRVFYIEEAKLTETMVPLLNINRRDGGIFVAKPEVPRNFNASQISLAQKKMLENLIHDYHIRSYVNWYYTPMALHFTRFMTPLVSVYDCMDELSLFKFASPELPTLEAELFRRVDVVFTGGHSLYEAKKNCHYNIFALPSSIDYEHFATARKKRSDPSDQITIPKPRLGFFGVVDERMDLKLIENLASSRPDWHIVIIGPVVKIDHASLPTAKNIHYLGAKNYLELPQYISSWDVALLPFAMNDSTRFISPTKTPEYLASGIPVVSTPIKDVITPYEDKKLVKVARNLPDFIDAIEANLKIRGRAKKAWLTRVDECLKETSWNLTWQKMCAHVNEALELKSGSQKLARRYGPPSFKDWVVPQATSNND